MRNLIILVCILVTFVNCERGITSDTIGVPEVDIHSNISSIEVNLEGLDTCEMFVEYVKFLESLTEEMRKISGKYSRISKDERDALLGIHWKTELWTKFHEKDSLGFKISEMYRELSESDKIKFNSRLDYTLKNIRNL